MDGSVVVLMRFRMVFVCGLLYRQFLYVHVFRRAFWEYLGLVQSRYNAPSVLVIDGNDK